MNAVIRKAMPEDLPFLLPILAELDGEKPMPLESAQQRFKQIEEIPNYHIYIACKNAEAVGTFSLIILPTLMHGGVKTALIDAVAVSRKYQGQGIGKMMVREALRLCAAAGCYKLTLSSSLVRDRAHAFYKSLGFRQHGWSFSLEIEPGLQPFCPQEIQAEVEP